jgi:hypothetical protein
MCYRDGRVFVPRHEVEILVDQDETWDQAQARESEERKPYPQGDFCGPLPGNEHWTIHQENPEFT